MQDARIQKVFRCYSVKVRFNKAYSFGELVRSPLVANRLSPY